MSERSLENGDAHRARIREQGWRTMAEMRESSVLFSLNQLMHLEEERVRNEERAAFQQAEALEAARREAERRARAEHEATAQAEAERQRAEAAAQREEAARHEAIRQVALTKAQIEAEHEARLAHMAQQQVHERELVRIAQDSQRHRLKQALVAGAVLTVGLFGGTAGVYFGHVVPQNDARLRQELDAHAQVEATARRLMDDQVRADKALDEALRALHEAKSEAERVRAQAQADKATKDAEQAPKNLSRTKRPLSASRTNAPAKPCARCLHPGDPLCDCLK